MKIAKVQTVPLGSELKKVSKGTRFINIGYTRRQVLPETDPSVRECYEVFNSQKDLEKKMKKRENIWVFFPLKKTLSSEDQERYENFVSGFLHYYDIEIRNGMIDHTLWCDWKDKGVTVYLHPKPLRHPLKSGPGRMIKTAGQFLDQMKISDKQRMATIFDNKWTPPNVQGMQSDPPSPSGPPPPASDSV